MRSLFIRFLAILLILTINGCTLSLFSKDEIDIYSSFLDSNYIYESNNPKSTLVIVNKTMDKNNFDVSFKSYLENEFIKTRNQFKNTSKTQVNDEYDREFAEKINMFSSLTKPQFDESIDNFIGINDKPLILTGVMKTGKKCIYESYENLTNSKYEDKKNEPGYHTLNMSEKFLLKYKETNLKPIVLIELSRIGFNNQHDLALVYCNQFIAPSTGRGDFILFKKTQNKWKPFWRFLLWIK